MSSWAASENTVEEETVVFDRPGFGLGGLRAEDVNGSILMVVRKVLGGNSVTSWNQGRGLGRKDCVSGKSQTSILQLVPCTGLWEVLKKLL